VNQLNMIGIPGTLSPEAARIRWIRKADFLDPVSHAVCRVYHADVPDGFLVALLSRDLVPPEPGKLLWHLSVSHRDKANRPDRCPNWDELKHAFYRLVQEDVPFVLIFPRRTTPAEMYVNIHETTLHLWESQEGGIDR